MNKVNYSKETEKILEQIAAGADPEEGQAPRLLLHSCCAPCSSHCMEYLREHFRLTVFYYNPNITVSEEYEKRLAEEKRLIAAYNRQVEDRNFDGMHSTASAHRIDILEAPYDPEDWFVVGAGDYNGDQKDDLLVRQYSTGTLGYYVCADQSKWTELGNGVSMEWTVIA